VRLTGNINCYHFDIYILSIYNIHNVTDNLISTSEGDLPISLFQIMPVTEYLILDESKKRRLDIQI